MPSKETIEPFFPTKSLPIITHGLPYPLACAQHLTDTLHSGRAFIICSKSISRDTDALGPLIDSIPRGKVVGICHGMQPHTLYSEVLAVAAEVKKCRADTIITLGGGSLIDGAKGIVFAIANDADTMEKLDALFKESNLHRHKEGIGSVAATHNMKPSTISIMCITTTLSAGEYNPVGGATHDETKHKQLFVDPSNTGPKVIIMDPELTLTTPERVWLSTGLRAVDHCVETICSSKPKPEGSVYSIKGIRLLIPSLLKTKNDPGNLDARLKAQLGGAESMKASMIEGVPVGGSHGIGHQLGPYGVPHAETTCVCLPAVQKFNAKFNSAQQREVLDVLWSEPDVAEVLRKHSLDEDKSDLGDALDAIIRELGFPRSLKAYGIGRDKLDAIAESSLGDVCSKWNAISLVEKEQVIEILEMCLEDEKENV